LPSFDDGFREMADVVAPILKAKGVSGMFFVNSAFVDNRELCFHQKIALLVGHLTDKPSQTLEEKLKVLLLANGINGSETIPMLRSVRYARRSVLDEAAVICGLNFETFLALEKPYLTSEQIRVMVRDGFAIGGHSVDHPFYGDLPLNEQLRQTQQSVEFVQNKFGIGYRAFAFPHSDSGVSREFFERSYGDGTLQISFGTDGLLRDPWPKHFQRFSMEKTSLHPGPMVCRQYARRLFRQTVQRTA
jgi:peptidoglycan/xylan/chitin deacetylase (PgdA/CDA1 family)